ncbi:DoxX family protein [Amycolatopsis pigmentata]|uniref:DoxX family protein n=1 Tax=Amycolatopsis pigmentata TaxID=450801 RepID=A0ABW5G4B4_9PSEU
MTADDDDYGRRNLFTNSGYSDSAETSRSSDYDDYDSYDGETRPATRWHGGLDFGLLIMRLALGGTLGVHGLQKAFGLFGGPGINEFARILGDQGFTSQTTLLAWLGGLAEVAGGALLIIGLFTPAAAGALMSVSAAVVYLTYADGYFLDGGKGYEYHALMGAFALGLLFTGPGRISLDVNTPWRRNPVPFAILGIVLGGGAAVAVMLLFHHR